MEEKYGFVYIWYDRKHKRFYIGSHWGTVDDGYICSSVWMRNAYKRRSHDFSRRVIKSNIPREDLIREEQYWLDMVAVDEIGTKYYNLNKNVIKHWHADPERRIAVGQKISASPNRSANISKAMKGKKPSTLNIQRRMEVMIGRKQSEEEKRKRSESLMGHKHSDETKEKLRKPKPKITCPHCNKVGGVSSMARWHLDKCKYK